MFSSIKYLLLVSLIVIGAMLILPGFFSEKTNAHMPVLPEVVDYNFHIKPIISDRCFKCHGPDKLKQESELGLHDQHGLFKALKDEPSRFVVVPEQPEESELYLRIMEVLLLTHGIFLVQQPTSQGRAATN